MSRAQTPWATSWESVAWTPSPHAYPLSRAARSAIRPTYRAAIPPAIGSLEVAIDPAVLAAADDARAEVSRFDAELITLVPGGELAPLSAVLLRAESASSSQVENITVHAKALALAEAGAARHGGNARLVVGNVQAMQRAIDLDGELTPASILAVHDVLMQGQPHANPGTFRSEQVWIGGSSASPHSAQFVPPQQARVPAAIDDLCAFMARTDVPLIAQAAIAHAQFETIHPFNEGNGRTGRAVVHAMLKRAGATTRATVPVSAGLLTDTESYFSALTAYRDGDLNPIVARFTEATFAAIGNGRELADDLSEVVQKWEQAISARRSASIWQVLPLLLSRPALSSAHLQQATGLSQPAADRVIAQLVEAGILTKGAGSKRYVVWVASDVTTALDAFADRARWRRR